MSVSETSLSRVTLAPFCVGHGLDIGFGGDAVVPSAWTMDLVDGSYTNVGGDRQILRGTAGDLSGFCDGALDYIYSSHLLEDFTYPELVKIIKEWRRVLREGGLIVTNCPDQQKFLAHCARTGQGLNAAHKEDDFSLETFLTRVVQLCGAWEAVVQEPEFGPYSFLLVLKKI